MLTIGMNESIFPLTVVVSMLMVYVFFKEYED